MRWTWYWAALLFSPALAFTTQSSLPSRDVKIWSSRFSFLNRRREELEAERAAAAAAAAVAAAEAARPPEWTRRAALQGGVLTAASLYASTETNRDQYGLWGTLPIGPYKTKRTAPMETIVDGVMWSFDQKFGILNVQVPSRMVVIKLSAASGGGLWIYNPIAATRNLVECVRALEKVHGPVRHIVLGTVAIEHKTYCGPFAQKFPQATVWLQPGQYAVPLDLSPELVGFPTGGRTKVLPAKAADTPWAADLDQETLGPFISRDGAFGETAFFHAATKTVVLTDTVVQVTDELPEIYRLDKRPLLYHSRTTITDVIDPNDEESLRRGWRRIQLFGLFFMPAGIDVKSVDEAFRARRPDINGDFAGLFPWDWVGDDDVKSFEAIRGGRGSEKNGKNGGGLLVAPILQTLILNRNPAETRAELSRGGARPSSPRRRGARAGRDARLGRPRRRVGLQAHRARAPEEQHRRRRGFLPPRLHVPRGGRRARGAAETLGQGPADAARRRSVAHGERSHRGAAAEAQQGEPRRSARGFQVRLQEGDLHAARPGGSARGAIPEGLTDDLGRVVVEVRLHEGGLSVFYTPRTATQHSTHRSSRSFLPFFDSLITLKPCLKRPHQRAQLSEWPKFFLVWCAVAVLFSFQ